jgi:hypothetical protein
MYGAALNLPCCMNEFSSPERTSVHTPSRRANVLRPGARGNRNAGPSKQMG